MVYAFGIGTPAVPENFFAITTVCAKTLSNKAAVRTPVLRLPDWVGGLVAYGGGSTEQSSSPRKCLNVLVNGDAIHTVAFRASEARSLAPGLSVARHDDQDTLIQRFAYQRAQWVRRRFPNLFVAIYHSQ